MWDKFPPNGGVRQGDPISPTLFTAVMEKIFDKADISERINLDGELLANLRFLHLPIKLPNSAKKNQPQNKWKKLSFLSSESLKVGLKYAKKGPNRLQSTQTVKIILTEQKKWKQVTKFKYFGKTTHLNDTTTEEIYARITTAWSCLKTERNDSRQTDPRITQTNK